MRSWHIFSIGHTDIFLHPAVLPCVVYAFLTGHGTLCLMASFSVIIHECAHAITAALFKRPPLALEWTPLGAVMRIADEARLPPLKRATMLAAGPLSSMILCWISMHFFNEDELIAEQAHLLFISSLSIVLLNLLPAFPLDGGRLFHLIISCLFTDRIANHVMHILGSITGFGLILLNLYVSVMYGGWNLSLACAGCSILYSTSASMTTFALQELRMLMDRKIALEQRGIIRCTVFCAMENTPLRKLLQVCPSKRQVFFCVVASGTMKVLGYLSEYQVIHHYLADPGMAAKEALFLCQNHSESAKYDTI